MYTMSEQKETKWNTTNGKRPLHRKKPFYMPPRNSVSEGMYMHLHQVKMHGGKRAVLREMRKYKIPFREF